MKGKAFSLSIYEKQLFDSIEHYAKIIDSLYSAAMNEFIKIALTIGEIDPTKPFSFDDYPITDKRVKNLLLNLTNGIESKISEGVQNAWELSNTKNNKFVESIFSGRNVPASKLTDYNSRNLEALSVFQNRKRDGMNLSARVWKYTESFKSEMELAIDLGLDGRSSQKLSRNVRSLLNEPNKLFRRVRDKRGKLQLSKAAKAYHPGQGVYRSSFKNAHRLARTEINMAYREADLLRFQQFDLIVGYEVKRSNRNYPCVVCESLKGKYPKNFKFVGWHPQCMCFIVPILATENEIDDYIDKFINDESTTFLSDNEVLKPPSGFYDYVDQNNKRILNASSTPYFIRDNYQGADINKGLRLNIDNPIQLKDGYSLVKEGKDGTYISLHKDHVMNKNKKDGDKELEANLAQAEIYLKKVKTVELLPSYNEAPSLDARINGENFEFENVSKPKYQTIQHRISEASKQVLHFNEINNIIDGKVNLSISLPNDTPSKVIFSGIRLAMQFNPAIDNLNFTIGGKLIELTREDILNKKFYKIIEDVIKR
ncbi:hypothetical protein QM480_06545 [Flectobacillus sp. DC10W]|uniref:Uncharacterized protein n=1 Tax=Flectobacillus longus TaxID=2984207 RepID=A0ABT6YK63_9BACT|nr:hypothetical protein [Flectobacillus longus]MDI9863974.1 hypothetical protein [Flectobacillus longus]